MPDRTYDEKPQKDYYVMVGDLFYADADRDEQSEITRAVLTKELPPSPAPSRQMAESSAFYLGGRVVIREQRWWTP